MEDFKCSACGGNFPAHMRYDVGEKPLCPNCADWQTIPCIDCGKRFFKSDNKGDTENPLCPACWKRMVYGNKGE